MSNPTVPPSSAPEFNITRTFGAPRSKVWRAWTDPKRFVQWFGPRGFACEVKTFDLRAGGMAHSRLTSAAGVEMWARFVYRDVSPEHTLSWVHSFTDAAGLKPTRHPMSPDWPLEMLVTVKLEEQNVQTKLNLSSYPLNASAAESQVFKDGMSGMTQGWTGTFDQLDAYLKAE